MLTSGAKLSNMKLSSKEMLDLFHFPNLLVPFYHDPKMMLSLTFTYIIHTEIYIFLFSLFLTYYIMFTILHFAYIMAAELTKRQQYSHTQTLVSNLSLWCKM